MDYTQGLGKHVLCERMKSLDNCEEFQRVFKTRLRPFWQDNIFGFDIVGFDKWLEVPDNMSTRDFILDKYGQDGCDIVERLLA
jgi:hypothetical protein